MEGDSENPFRAWTFRPRSKAPTSTCRKFVSPACFTARVVRPPALGAHVQNVDKNVLNGLPGNPQVVQINDFVGVVADTEWHAIKAAEALGFRDHLVRRRYASRSDGPLHVHDAAALAQFLVRQQRRRRSGHRVGG